MSKLTCVRSAKREGETYEEFKQARKAGFGGSDIGDLLDSEPYGCKRRLFLDRLGLLPDRGPAMAHHLERGRFLEGPVAGLYAARTGRELREVGTGYLKEFPFVRANADRLVRSDQVSLTQHHGSWGVLEIKCPSAWSFKKIKKEGLPESYVLQLQWQMLCYGTSWGSFAVYWADGHELLWFDVERDDALIQMLFERAQAEWEALEWEKNALKGGFASHESFFAYPRPAGQHFPGTKDSHSTACANCPGFQLCHERKYTEAGVVIVNDELQPAAERYSALTTQIKALEAEKEAIKDDFREQFALFPAEQITAGQYAITLREQERESLDTVAMKKELAKDLLVKYTKRTKYEVLTVKGIKL